MQDNKDELKREDSKDVVGAQFDDLTISEMAEVQGSGDVEAEVSTPVCAVAVSVSLSINVVKTLKGNC